MTPTPRPGICAAATRRAGWPPMRGSTAMRASAPRSAVCCPPPWARGAGQGRALMHQALRDCARLWPGEAVTLSAQAHLQHFYAALGFAAISEVYDEDGIPHIDMRRPAA